jgi:hypothetical protein
MSIISCKSSKKEFEIGVFETTEMSDKTYKSLQIDDLEAFFVLG